MKNDFIWTKIGKFWRGVCVLNNGKKEYFRVFYTGFWLWKTWYVTNGSSFIGGTYTSAKLAMKNTENVFRELK